MIALLLLTSISFNALCNTVTTPTNNQQTPLKKTTPAIYHGNTYKGTPVSLTGEHTVEKGETLFGIAKYYNINHKELLSANGMSINDGIKIGQKLKIPTKAPKKELQNDKKETKKPQTANKTTKDIAKTEQESKTHIVMQGETLFGIARMYSIHALDLATENNTDLNHMVKVGQKLKIPKTNEDKPSEKPQTPANKTTKDIAKTEQESKISHETNKSECTLSFIWPTHSRTIANKFGSAMQNGTKIDGIIIATEKGNNVFAAQSGTIAYAGTDISEYGKLMIIKHKDNWLTIYGYMDSFEKSVGQTVKAGEMIGKSGQTGDATQPAIYFSIRHTKKPYNPETCL